MEHPDPNFASHYTIDGNVSPNGLYWYHSPDASTQNWLQLDFGQSLYVNRLAIQTRVDCCFDRFAYFSVRVGDTAVTGGPQTIAVNEECVNSGPFMGATYREFWCTPLPIVGRYMTIQKTAADFWDVNEIRVWHLI